MREDMKKYLKIWSAVITAFAIFIYFIYGRSEGKVHLSPAKPGIVVAFGDSITQGVGATAPEKTYPARLEALVGRKVINSGRAGDTTYQALERLASDVLVHQPAVVIIGLGSNDEIRRIPNETTAMNLGHIVAKIHEAGAMAAFLDIDPPAGGWRFKLLRKQNGDMAVLQIDGVMRGFWGNRELMSDTIHPSDAGYQLLAERVAAALKPHLQ